MNMMLKVKAKMSILEMLLFEQNNPKFRETRTYSLPRADYGLCALYLCSSTRKVTVQFCVIYETFHRNLYDKKYV